MKFDFLYGMAVRGSHLCPELVAFGCREGAPLCSSTEVSAVLKREYLHFQWLAIEQDVLPVRLLYDCTVKRSERGFYATINAAV